MSEHELNRAVAQATGESIAEISRRGFQAEAAEPRTIDADWDDYRIDWDAVLAARLTNPFAYRRPRPAVA